MKQGYNERIFNKKQLRGQLHYARFLWLEKTVKRYFPEVNTVLELGCFDGKAIDFLPPNITAYHAYDANWENGLDKARAKYGSRSNFRFFNCRQISDFIPPENAFDIAICMETMEHLPVVEVEEYIDKLARATREYCFVTVPNEKGIVFLLKFLFKKIVHRQLPAKYSLRDIYYSSIGRMSKVVRKKGHRGFDYSTLLLSLKKRFDVLEVEGIPFNFFPVSLNFTVGMVLKKRKEELGANQ